MTTKHPESQNRTKVENFLFGTNLIKFDQMKNLHCKRFCFQMFADINERNFVFLSADRFAPTMGCRSSIV